MPAVGLLANDCWTVSRSSFAISRDEVYYVGEFTFYTGGFDSPAQRLNVGVGQTVALAGGTPLTIRNESDADAVAFVVHAPGAPMEYFSRAPSPFDRFRAH